jgi:hypothetical protein
LVWFSQEEAFDLESEEIIKQIQRLYFQFLNTKKACKSFDLQAFGVFFGFPIRRGEKTRTSDPPAICGMRYPCTKNLWIPLFLIFISNLTASARDATSVSQINIQGIPVLVDLFLPALCRISLSARFFV